VHTRVRICPGMSAECEHGYCKHWAHVHIPRCDKYDSVTAANNPRYPGESSMLDIWARKHFFFRNRLNPHQALDYAVTQRD